MISALFGGYANGTLRTLNGENAMEDFNKSIEINPHYATAYFSRADLFTRMGEAVQAEEDKMVGDKLLVETSKAYYQSQGIAFDKP